MDYFELIFKFILDFQTLISTSLASIVAGGIAWKFKSQKQTLDKNEFKRKIFLEYNDKYNNLNDYLELLVHTESSKVHKLSGGFVSLDERWNQLVNDKTGKMPDYIKAAFDYINLCAEEHYWYKKGYVDAYVWTCWRNGMRSWHKKSFFMKKIIERESSSSYYHDDFLDCFTEESNM